jgi:hypothetical protein
MFYTSHCLQFRAKKIESLQAIRKWHISMATISKLLENDFPDARVKTALFPPPVLLRDWDARAVSRHTKELHPRRFEILQKSDAAHIRPHNHVITPVLAMKAEFSLMPPHDTEWLRLCYRVKIAVRRDKRSTHMQYSDAHDGHW